MATIGVLAGGIAHNFNNNLSIILGNIEILRTKIPAVSEMHDYLNNAKSAILSCRDLVMQILTYSSQGPHHKKPVVLSLVLEETIMLMTSILSTTVKLQTTTSPAAAEAAIKADSSQIQEILINLCNNAVQAMEEKGVLTITLDAVDIRPQDIPIPYDRVPGAYLKLSVKDTGRGIAADTVDKIFDPFFTTKEVGEGTGMGLATVQGIVDQHNGFIKVKSAPDEGSTFEIYFPIFAPETVEASSHPPQATELPTGNERILFLDDDKMIAHLGEQLLSGVGYQVTALTDSLTALELFRKKPDQFDLIISDQSMSGLSGKDFIAEVLSIRPEMPTILMTGYSSRINDKEAQKLGIKAFCLKPMDLPEMLRIIRGVLDENRTGVSV